MYRLQQEQCKISKFAFAADSNIFAGAYLVSNAENGYKAETQKSNTNTRWFLLYVIVCLLHRLFIFFLRLVAGFLGVFNFEPHGQLLFVHLLL